jgi:cobyrinic acid a,c-diamide synthase
MGSDRRGLMLAAPSSGSGKTILTLALLRAFSNHGDRFGGIRGAKAGPDFIDPVFHAIACGVPSYNLDPFAMDTGRLIDLAHAGEGDLLFIEAMMGLFDGAADGSGSGADLAATLDLPVVLVVDAAKQSHSIAALVQGFASFRRDVAVRGVLLNKVGSARHEAMLRQALEPIGLPVLGAIPRHEDLILPERHLGLVQAGEMKDIEPFMNRAAQIVESHCDLEAIEELAALLPGARAESGRNRILPIGQRVAIARDAAFTFAYPHLLEDWRKAGVEVLPFSPLANEAPSSDADAVYLPGGYPELHCGQLAAADNFARGLNDAKKRGAVIYGECGGYMVLGRGIVDRDGQRFAMTGLLNLETSFHKRRLHLGYRRVCGLGEIFGDMRFSAHEFHYTCATKEEGEALYSAEDALGVDLGNAGLRDGRVCGSYLHVIDRIG